MTRSLQLLLLLVIFIVQFGRAQDKENYDPDFLSKQSQSEIQKQSQDSLQPRIGKRNIGAKFLRFQKEVTMDIGLYIPFQNPYNIEASVYSLQGAYFFSNYERFGIRSGISYYKGFEGSEYYIGIPLFASYRIELNSSIYPVGYSFGEIFRNFLINIIPKNIEFGVGPNLGYIQPDNYRQPMSYFIDKRFALSIDANMRMTFRIWRLGLALNPTISYLTTKNFKLIYPENKKLLSQPSFFFKGTVGLSFLF